MDVSTTVWPLKLLPVWSDFSKWRPLSCGVFKIPKCWGAEGSRSQYASPCRISWRWVKPLLSYIHAPKIWVVLEKGRELGPHLTQCGLGRGLPPYQVASWSIQPFGHNTPTSQTGERGHTGRPDRHDRQRFDSIGEPFYKRSLRKTAHSVIKPGVKSLGRFSYFDPVICLHNYFVVSISE